MVGRSTGTDRNDSYTGNELERIQLQLESLARMTNDFPIECSVGTFDFLFESRDDIEIILDNLTEEISTSKKAA
jgi:hypothetical protein